jgi:hypothetical protein
MMPIFLTLIFAVVAVLWHDGSGMAQGVASPFRGDSAASIVPGCRSSTSADDSSRAFEEGVCIGLLKGLYYLSTGACIPPAVTMGEIARIVVRYVDDHPARQQEDFREIALEALRAAWPCSGVRNIKLDD